MSFGTTLVLEEGDMAIMTITVSEARKRLFPLVEQVNGEREPVEIKSRRGDAYLVSKDQYDELLATLAELRRIAAGSPMETRMVDEMADSVRHNQGSSLLPTVEGSVPDVLVETDDRRRVSLGRLGWHRRYLAHDEPDGSIVLTPAVVMSESQARLLARPDVMKIIDDFLADPKGTGVVRPRPMRRRQSS
jgi:antitoxin YefM